jgi:hypothetical protein
MSVTVGSNVYHDTFRIDGNPHPEVLRPYVMQMWRQTGPVSWESTETRDGQVIHTIRRTVSSDGRTLTHAISEKTKDAKSVAQTAVYERISGEKSGLVGTWKRISVHADAPDVLSFRITPDGALSYAGQDETYIVKPDGKQYPSKGDFDTVSLKSSDDRTIEITLFEGQGG